MAKVLPVALWLAADAADRTRTIGLMNPGDFIATTGGTIEVMLTGGTLLAAGGTYTLPTATTSVIGGVKQSTTMNALTNTTGSGATGQVIAPVTDITTANNAVSLITDNLSTLVNRLKTAGIMV